jgi:phosphoribosylformimino-5-aminoimidazole carboxamide ribonucleotide (ProFAR) isomerase
MATAIQRASAIIDALVDGTATNEQKLAIANAYVKQYAYRLREYDIDEATITNEQKAKLFMTIIREQVRDVYMAGQEKATYDTVQSAAQAARAAAAAEIGIEAPLL